MTKDVILAADKKYYPAIETLVFTILSKNSNIRFHLLTMNWDGLIGGGPEKQMWHMEKITPEQVDRFHKIIQYFNNNSTLHYYDVKEQYDKYLNRGPNLTSVFTPYTTLRLLIDILLPINIKNAIYFDADVLCFENLDTIFNKYKNINFPTICPDGDENITYIPFVAFFNLNICRKTNFFSKCRDLITTRQYNYPDMEAISEVLDSYKNKIFFEEITGHEGLSNLDGCKIVHLAGYNEGEFKSTRNAFFTLHPNLVFIKNEINSICGPVEYFIK